MAAIAILVLLRFLGDVKHLSPMHQVQSLFIARRVGIRHCRSASIGEKVIHSTTQLVTALVCLFGKGFRTLRVFGRITISQNHAGVFRSKVGGVIATISASTRCDLDVARK